MNGETQLHMTSSANLQAVITTRSRWFMSSDDNTQWNNINESSVWFRKFSLSHQHRKVRAKKPKTWSKSSKTQSRLRSETRCWFIRVARGRAKLTKSLIAEQRPVNVISCSTAVISAVLLSYAEHDRLRSVVVWVSLDSVLEWSEKLVKFSARLIGSHKLNDHHKSADSFDGFSAEVCVWHSCGWRFWFQLQLISLLFNGRINCVRCCAVDEFQQNFLIIFLA